MNGLNVHGDGRTPVDFLRRNNIQFVRMVLYPHLDIRPTLKAYSDAGITSLLLLARESHGPDMPDTWSEEVARRYLLEYKNRYQFGDQYNIWWQYGNEEDHVSGSSWTIPQEDYQRALYTTRDMLGSNATIVCGGAVSGRPDWWSGMDLSPITLFSIHGYGQGTPNMRSPYGFPDDFGYLIQRYKDVIGEYLFVMTEFGVNTNELRGIRPDATLRSLRGIGPSRTQQPPLMTVLGSQYAAEVVRYLNTRSDVVGVAYFCAEDTMVDGFGVLDADGNSKPVHTALKPVWGYREDPPPPPPAPDEPYLYERGLGFEKWYRLEPTLLGRAITRELNVYPQWQTQPTEFGVLSWVGGKGHAFVTHDGRVYRWQEDWSKSERIV